LKISLPVYIEIVLFVAGVPTKDVICTGELSRSL
jgi:hypothetical protein